MTTLKVKIDRDLNLITVWNDGNEIPVYDIKLFLANIFLVQKRAMHEKERIYVPELIFGNLMSGENFDDDKLRTVGGRNGFGAKLTNIYSTMFKVNCGDSKNKKQFQMIWKNNMESKSEPKITPYVEKSNFTEISFTPDLKRFKMQSLDADIVSLMIKRVYDLAGIFAGKFKVVLNDERIKINKFEEYVDLYL